MASLFERDIEDRWDACKVLETDSGKEGAMETSRDWKFRVFVHDEVCCFGGAMRTFWATDLAGLAYSADSCRG